MHFNVHYSYSVTMVRQFTYRALAVSSAALYSVDFEARIRTESEEREKEADNFRVTRSVIHRCALSPRRS